MAVVSLHIHHTISENMIKQHWEDSFFVRIVLTMDSTPCCSRFYRETCHCILYFGGSSACHFSYYTVSFSVLCIHRGNTVWSYRKSVVECISSVVAEAVIVTHVSHPVRVSLTTTPPVYSHSILYKKRERNNLHSIHTVTSMATLKEHRNRIVLKLLLVCVLRMYMCHCGGGATYRGENERRICC